MHARAYSHSYIVCAWKQGPSYWKRAGTLTFCLEKSGHLSPKGHIFLRQLQGIVVINFHLISIFYPYNNPVI